jgi:hypothetical protein
MKNWFVTLSSNPVLVWILLGLVAWGIYFQTYRYGFALDDAIVISENKFVEKGVDGLYSIFANESFTGYFGKQTSYVAGARYRPLSIASFALEYELYKYKPAYSHLINVFLYWICCGLIYFAVRKLFSYRFEREASSLVAFVTAMIFLVHPTHVEAVANIKGRDEIMSTLFAVAALICTLKYHDTRKWIWTWITGMIFFLALMSKENPITLLIAFPVLLYYISGFTWKEAFRYMIPYGVSSLAFILLRVKVIGYLFDTKLKIVDLMNDPFVEMNFIQKWCTILYTVVWYIKLLFVPHPLTHDYYPYHVPIMNPTSPGFLLALATVILSLWIAWKCRKSHSIVTMAILFFYITLSIVSNAIFPVGTFMNERFLFLPSLGFCIVLGYYFYTWSQSSRKQLHFLGIGGSLVILLLFSLKSFLRVPAWESGDSLNLSAIGISKNSARINLFTGVTYFHKYESESDQIKKYQDLDIAEKYIDRALEIYPRYSQGHIMKVGVYAEKYKKDNDLVRFLQSIKKSAGMYPELTFTNEFLTYLKKENSNHAELAKFFKEVGYDVLYKKNRNYPFAIQYLKDAQAMDPLDGTVNQMLATVYLDYASFGKLEPGQVEYLKQQAATLMQSNMKQ